MSFTKAVLRLPLFASLLLVLSACGSSNSTKIENGGGGSAGKANRLNWEAVPRDYNPSIETLDFETFDATRIKADLFGFDDDVELIYSNDLEPNAARIRLYKVWSQRASWGRLATRMTADTVMADLNGQYECSISIKNGAIAALEGGCYVRLQIVLPVGSKVEVYNVGKLISRRFIAMSNAELIASVDEALTKEAKLAAIDTWLRSYSAIGQRPKLTSEEIGTVVYELTWKEEKLTALGKLQSFATDRENLVAMIESRFSYFEREEARRVCGL